VDFSVKPYRSPTSCTISTARCQLAGSRVPLAQRVARSTSSASSPSPASMQSDRVIPMSSVSICQVKPGSSVSRAAIISRSMAS
jgi:hypothetical protein